MKKLVAVVAGAGIAVYASVAFADPDPTKVPLQNALEHVLENGAKNPQAPGLRNARDRIVTNAARQEEHRQNHPHKAANGKNSDSKDSGGKDAGGAGVDRARGVEHVKRTERPELPERTDRPDHPDRPGQDRVVRFDRPISPGHARK